MPSSSTMRIPATFRETNPRWSGILLLRSAPLTDSPDGMTTDQDRKLLLRLARDTIAAHVGRSYPDPQSAICDPQSAPTAVLAQFCGAFVTLHKQGDLRGCIGHIGANEPLAMVVPRCAAAACSADPRFAPI